MRCFHNRAHSWTFVGPKSAVRREAATARGSRTTWTIWESANSSSRIEPISMFYGVKIRLRQHDQTELLNDQPTHERRATAVALADEDDALLSAEIVLTGSMLTDSPGSRTDRRARRFGLAADYVRSSASRKDRRGSTARTATDVAHRESTLQTRAHSFQLPQCDDMADESSRSPAANSGKRMT